MRKGRWENVKEGPGWQTAEAKVRSWRFIRGGPPLPYTRENKVHYQKNSCSSVGFHSRPILAGTGMVWTSR